MALLIAASSSDELTKALNTFEQLYSFTPIAVLIVPFIFLLYNIYEDIVTTDVEKYLRGTRKKFFVFFYKNLFLTIIMLVVFFSMTFLQITELLNELMSLSKDQWSQLLNDSSLKSLNTFYELNDLNLTYKTALIAFYLVFFILLFIGISFVFWIMKILELVIGIKYYYYIKIDNEFWKIMNISNKREIITEKNEVIKILPLDEYKEYYRIPSESNISLKKQAFYKDRITVNKVLWLLSLVTISFFVLLIVKEWVQYLIVPYVLAAIILMILATKITLYKYEK